MATTEFRRKLRDGLYVRSDGSDLLEALTGKDFPFVIDMTADAFAVKELGYEEIDEDVYMTLEIRPKVFIDFEPGTLFGVDLAGPITTVAESRKAAA